MVNGGSTIAHVLMAKIFFTGCFRLGHHYPFSRCMMPLMSLIVNRHHVTINPLVAQLDRAFDHGSEGYGFESHRADVHTYGGGITVTVVPFLHTPLR